MKYDAFYPGKLWTDTGGKPIQAHGFSVFYSEEDGCYYWYGENKEKTKGGPFNHVWHWGVRCYSSRDLYNWEDRGLIIPPQPDDLTSPLHPAQKMDRPHILYCPNTGKYVAWLKIQGCTVESQMMCVMQADRFLGPYEFVHKTCKPLHMNTGDFDLRFNAETGKAYFLFDRPHFEIVTATLSDDFCSVTGEYSEHYEGLIPPFSREAPACFEKDGWKYMLTSGVTSYYPNPTRVCRFRDWHGEYEDLGEICVGDVDRTSFYGQFTCVLKVHGTDRYIAMADRWKPTALGRWLTRKYYAMVVKAMVGKQGERFKTPDRSPKTDMTLSDKQRIFPQNTSISRYVWLPLEWKDGRPEIRWYDKWRWEDIR